MIRVVKTFDNVEERESGERNYCALNSDSKRLKANQYEVSIMFHTTWHRTDACTEKSVIIEEQGKSDCVE